MTRGIGWYVHHQGAGHLQRARAVSSALARPCTLIGTLAGLDTGGLDVLDLPDDRPLDGSSGFDGRDGEAERPEALHYAPLNHPGIRSRMARIAAWAARSDPAVIVVDVSVEVALFARLLSVPTIVVRLAGTRTDTPHREAFRSAARLLAPFPRELDGDAVPDRIRAKTFYAGFLGGPAPLAQPSGEDIVVVFGRGGSGGVFEDLAAAARSAPARHWHVLGPVSGAGERPDNLHLHGWVGDVDALVARAALLVGGGGDGLFALAARHSKRFVCLPEPRAYGEQWQKASALARLGGAIVHEGWPDPAVWPRLLEAGLALDPAAIARFHDPDAIASCADMIDDIARSTDAA